MGIRVHGLSPSPAAGYGQKAISPPLAGLRHFQTLIAADGRLYVGADGRLYAFGVTH
jgi:hypothetical protein